MSNEYKITLPNTRQGELRDTFLPHEHGALTTLTIWERSARSENAPAVCDAMNNVSVGPALPPSLKERQERGRGAEAVGAASEVPTGPPLPPGLAARDCSDGAGGKGARAGDNATIGPPLPPPSPPRAAVTIGPPLPPGMVRGAVAATPVGPALPPGMRSDGDGTSVIGPALPPGMARGAGTKLAADQESPSAAERAPTSRKREWDRVRSAAAGPATGAASVGDAGTAAHPGDEGREEWMTVAPVFDKRQAVLAAQGLGGFATPSEGPKRPPGPPRRPGDAAYEAQGGEDSGSGSDGDDEQERGGGNEQKRVKYSAGPSLLERHVSRAEEVASRQEGRPRYRQFDREKEFTDHKKRDASFYATKAGGLGARYGPAQRGDK